VKRGLSLLELLIVLAVLGLLLGLGVPNFLRWRAQAEVDEAARSLAQAFQYARAEAKRTNAQDACGSGGMALPQVKAAPP